MVATPVLEAGAERRVGSSPTLGTNPPKLGSFGDWFMCVLCVPGFF